ncbi:ANTAR domain-containing protein [Lentzea sp. NPDC003310]|uniref:ANTAR domain-containing protein n=1 Tax=Lentzea sp. NPDC003310 TaxID=3154447 RepID=UPI0033B5FD76
MTHDLTSRSVLREHRAVAGAQPSPAAELDTTAALRVLDDAATAVPPPEVVVLDLRHLGHLTASGVRNLGAFARAQADRGVRCALVVDEGGAVARVLETAEPLLARFGDLDSALRGSSPAAADRRVDDLIPRFEELTRTLLATTTVADALRQVVLATRHVVPAAEVVSVTLRDQEGRFVTPVETDAVATALDEVQYRTGRGPCVDAALPDGPGYVVGADLRGDRRWPEFSAACVAHGLVGVLATEIMAAGDDTAGGALNIYTSEPASIDETDRHAALLLGTHASLALAHVKTAEVALLHTAQLRQAIATRDIIGQAKGILMNRQGIDADEAFALLRRTSQDLNVKLVEVATTLVTRHGELADRLPSEGGGSRQS